MTEKMVETWTREDRYYHPPHPGKDRTPKQQWEQNTSALFQVSIINKESFTTLKLPLVKKAWMLVVYEYCNVHAPMQELLLLSLSFCEPLLLVSHCEQTGAPVLKCNKK